MTELDKPENAQVVQALYDFVEVFNQHCLAKIDEAFGYGYDALDDPFMTEPYVESLDDDTVPHALDFDSLSYE